MDNVQMGEKLQRLGSVQTGQVTDGMDNLSRDGP